MNSYPRRRHRRSACEALRPPGPPVWVSTLQVDLGQAVVVPALRQQSPESASEEKHDLVQGESDVRRSRVVEEEARRLLDQHDRESGRRTGAPVVTPGAGSGGKARVL